MNIISALRFSVCLNRFIFRFLSTQYCVIFCFRRIGMTSRAWRLGFSLWFLTTRQAMYAWRKIEARARCNCCRGKGISMTYFCVWGGRGECVHMYVCGCTGAGVCLLACSLTYSARKALPYCLQPLWLHHIFRHYLINGTIFEKKLLNIKCVFWFHLQFWYKTFLIPKIIQRDIVINVKTSSCEVPVILDGF
jgi:hypothetical protein